MVDEASWRTHGADEVGLDGDEVVGQRGKLRHGARLLRVRRNRRLKLVEPRLLAVSVTVRATGKGEYGDD